MTQQRPSSRFVILNADDFGYSSIVNRAIQKAHLEGVLTSASLMVAEEGFAEAVQLAKEMPHLGVGLHLVVTLDRPVLPPHAIPHLIRPNGRLDADLFRAGLRYSFSKKAQKELAQEIEAQFARFGETGLAWSHVDGHQHFHLPPIVWDTLLSQAVKHGVHRLRYPSEPIRDHLRSGGQPANLDTVASLVFRALRRRNLSRLKEFEKQSQHSFFLCDRVYGHLQTGKMNLEYCTRLLGRLEGATNEIYFHPGASHAMLLPPDQQTAEVKDVELKTLLAPEFRQRLQEEGVQWGNYHEAEQWRKNR